MNYESHRGDAKDIKLNYVPVLHFIFISSLFRPLVNTQIPPGLFHLLKIVINKVSALGEGQQLVNQCRKDLQFVTLESNNNFKMHTYTKPI